MTRGWTRKALLLGAAALLVTLLGCGETTPVQKPSQRGMPTGPLPGAPEEQPFVEAGVPPPAYPRDRDLIPFEIRGDTTNRFLIDGSTLSVTEDGVVHFVLVIRTADGVDNVRFAGLRCSEREWKDYAFARVDHTWVAVRDPQWQPVHTLRLNDYQGTLYKDYFCTSGAVSSGPAGSVAKLVDRLKHPPKPDQRVPRTE